MSISPLSSLRASCLAAAEQQASRILAIAMVLDGFSREEAARLCGMDWQTLRDRQVRRTT
jgi:hypothetical protein